MALKPIRVSQLNQYIKRILQMDPILANVSVTGEISNLKYHDTGHVYFTLKDEFSKLSCFMPASSVSYLRYELDDGMEVTASGRINVYEKGGTYSLNVSHIEVSGAGDLAVAYNRLKEKLEKEGLFDLKHKKAIPTFSRQIVVITAETGAAVRDIIRTIRNKNDRVSLIVYPCLVQGNEAAADISRAIEQVNLIFTEADCIILGRGGGSTEELWAFNEEIVARSIFASKIPVISAVGHETDFTIADFVADFRAATPTAAAELAAFDSRALQNRIDEMKAELRRGVQNRLRHYELKISANSMYTLKVSLLRRLEKYTIMTEHLLQQMAQSEHDRLRQADIMICGHRETLENLNPARLLSRGYGAVTDGNGAFIRSVNETQKNAQVLVTLADGRIECEVQSIHAQK